MPARAYLTVIQRNPEAVLEALRPAAADVESAGAAGRKKHRPTPELGWEARRWATARFNA